MQAYEKKSNDGELDDADMTQVAVVYSPVHDTFQMEVLEDYLNRVNDNFSGGRPILHDLIIGLFKSRVGAEQFLDNVRSEISTSSSMSNDSPSIHEQAAALGRKYLQTLPLKEYSTPDRLLFMLEAIDDSTDGALLEMHSVCSFITRLFAHPDTSKIAVEMYDGNEKCIKELFIKIPRVMASIAEFANTVFHDDLNLTEIYIWEMEAELGDKKNAQFKLNHFRDLLCLAELERELHAKRYSKKTVSA